MDGGRFAYGPAWRGGQGLGSRGTRGRRRDPLVMVLLLQFWQQYQQLEWKPPLTVGLIAVQALIHFHDELPLPPEVGALIPSISQACLIPYQVIKAGQWWRLLWSAVIHADDLHLYYNMSSLLIKGATLERRMGSLRLGLLLAELLTVSQLLMAGGLYWLGEVQGLNRSWSRSTCAVGFSGVLFALKYVLTYNQAGSEELWLAGWHVPLPFRVPVKYIAWAELVLVHLMLPGTSFTGHLCGVLAGVLHCHVIRPLLATLQRRRRGGFRGTGRRLHDD